MVVFLSDINSEVVHIPKGWMGCCTGFVACLEISEGGISFAYADSACF